MLRPLSFGVCVLVCVQCLVHVSTATDIIAASVSTIPVLNLPHRGRNQTDNMSLHPQGNRTGRPTRAGLLEHADDYTNNMAPYPVLGVPTRGRNRTGRISLQPTRAGLLEQAQNYTTNRSKTQLPAGDTQHDPSNVNQWHDYSFIESILNISKHSNTSRPIDNTLVLALANMFGRMLGMAQPPNTTGNAPDNATPVLNTPKSGQENAHHEPHPRAAAHTPPPHFRHTRRQRSAVPQDADQMQIHTVPRSSQHKGHVKHTQAPR